MSKFADAAFQQDLRSGQYTTTELATKYPHLTIKSICDYAYYHRIKCPRHKRVDESFFQKQTPDLAYVLGWLASDGCVSDENVIALMLKSSDGEAIRNIASLIGLKNPISSSSYLDKRTSKRYHRVCFRFQSKVVADELAKYGIVPRKSLTLCYPQNLESDELRRHFIRGYLDGKRFCLAFQDSF